MKTISQTLRRVLYGAVVLGAFTAGVFVGKIEPQDEKIQVVSVTSVVTRAEVDEQIKVIEASNIPAEAKQKALAHLTRQKESLPR